MKILMLGWEYPPLVTGGLATATEGLINGLLTLGHEITLVLPYYPFPINKNGLTVVSPERPFGKDIVVTEEVINTLDASSDYTKNIESQIAPTFAAWKSHYDYKLMGEWAGTGIDSLQEEDLVAKLRLREIQVRTIESHNAVPSPLFHTVEERSFVIGVLAASLLETQKFDIIHTHDWMTFPAFEILKQRTQIPIVAHVHSTEYDRSGDTGNQHILNIEKRGVSLATRVITVSRYTKSILINKLGVPEDKIEVAYNASNEQHNGDMNFTNDTSTDTSPPKEFPTVTFVGRITFQKGPAYFVHAAELVLKTNPKVKFRVVGTGDLLASMKQLVWELGINKSFVFDGFLDAKQVQEVLAESDIFVMPSVSEPFGIVALEAVQQNIPVIISKQSGVSEVLPNSLKVDFWDTELLADRILSLLKYHNVRKELVNNSQNDLIRRTWYQAALKCQEAYTKARKATHST